MTPFPAFAIALVFAGAPVLGQSEGPTEPWPLEFTDPAANGDSARPADLVLPMPCGASMAFQRVEVPVEVADPLSDRRIQLGIGEDETGYSDYLRPAFLRGPFLQTGSDSSHYYIARYEMTEGQYRVLQGDCAAPRRPKDRLAKGGMSWFEAVEMAQRYTTWLYGNAPDALPRRDGAPGFLRLPTDTEWEYATRGGAAVDPTVFPARHFFTEGTIEDYGLVFAPGSGNGRLLPVGLRAPNPLGLYDVYGNVEELIFEPFRLNALGRSHGQAGGIVTRGGSSFSAPSQVYSAQRMEYAPFDPIGGGPRHGEAFGMRLVISAHVTSSDTMVASIQSTWIEAAGARETAAGDDDARADPLNRLATLINAELDPRRQQELTELQLDIRRSRAAVDVALEQSAHASLLAGAAFVEAINTTAANIEFQRQGVLTLLDMSPSGAARPMFDGQIQTLQRRLRDARKLQCTYLASYRSTLEVLTTEIDREIRQRSYMVLREELLLSSRMAQLQTLDQFWSDVAAFELQPGMDTLGLLDLAMRTPPSQALRNATRC